MAYTHNHLNIGDRITVRGIDGDCVIISILDGSRGIKVCPIDGCNEVSWIDVADVTFRRRDYRASGVMFPSCVEAGQYLTGKGFEPHSEGYVREVGRYRYHASYVYRGDTRCVHLSFAEPELIG